jgi:hypothetical protein
MMDLILFALIWIFLGTGLYNTLKVTPRKEFLPVIFLWPLFLLIVAVEGKEFFDKY